MADQGMISTNQTRLAILVRPEIRMGFLLVTLLTWMVIAPMISDSSVLSIFLIAVIVSGVATVSNSRRTTVIAVALGIAPFLISAFSVAGYEKADPVRNFLVVLFLVYVVGLILRYIINVREVGAQILFGAIACYLLIGVIFMILHFSIENAFPGSFSASSGVPLAPYDFLYYSMVTLTTLGFGDITPTTHLAKGITVLEAISGVFYMGLIISRLVALIRSTESTAPI